MSESQSMPYPFRMPVELRAQVNALAKANNRSVNTELVLLVQEALSHRNSAGIDGLAAATPAGARTAVPPIDVDALADALAPRLAARLREAT